MITFYTTIDVSSLNIEKLLALPFMIEEVELEIEYHIPKYYPRTWLHPEEGGELEDWNVKVTDRMFSLSQRKKILELLDENAIVAAILAHHDTNND